MYIYMYTLYMYRHIYIYRERESMYIFIYIYNYQYMYILYTPWDETTNPVISDCQALPGNTNQLAFHKLAWKVMASPRSAHTVLHNTSAGVGGTDKKRQKWDQSYKANENWSKQLKPCFPPEEIEVLPLAQFLQFEMQGILDEVAHLLQMKIQIECDLEIH